MKVKVQFTVDIDAEAWANEFGLEMNGVRADVKQYIERIANDYITYQLGLSTQGF